MKMRRVVFGRVNRRDQSPMDQMPFDLEMLRSLEFARFGVFDGDKRWIVGDIEVDESRHFLAGVIGFTDIETRLHFDEATWSWVEAFSEEVEGASSQTVVPFAIDLRQDHRWTASVTSQRVRAQTFCRGLELVLKAHRVALGMQTDLEVDLVTSSVTIEEWIMNNPQIRSIKRIIRLPNPGIDISEDVRQMKSLNAKQKEETLTAHHNQSLRAVNDEGQPSDDIRKLTQGTDIGQVTISMEARGPEGIRKFSSVTNIDETYILDFDDDWQRGIALVLNALRQYSNQRAM